MKRYIKSSTSDKLIIFGKDRSKSPKRYIYQLCEYLGWNDIPMWTDSVVGDTV